MATLPDNLSIRCPAKLNLTLAVGPPREDGLHPIASVMTTLDFGDDLHLHRQPQGPSTFARQFANDAPKPQSIDWPIEHDLLFRAHAAMEQAVGHPLPIACALDKRIPAGAGLGGGSSNAAAMLVGLRTLFGLTISDGDLLAIAQTLGADVVFLVHAWLDQHTALVTGIGQLINPLPTFPPFDAVLIFPHGVCPTGEVYRIFDQTSDATPTQRQAELIETWQQAHTIPPRYNDLSHAACRVCPPIRQAMDRVKAHGLEPRLTGSGSSLFAVVESPAQADAVANTLAQQGLPACPASHARPDKSFMASQST